VRKANPKELKKLHYKLIKDYFRETANRKMGYYDTKNVEKLTHDYQQNKIWGICLEFIDEITKNRTEISSITELGCGIGDFTIDIAKRYPQFKEIIGIDFLDESIELSKRYEKKFENVKFIKKDLLNLPFKDRSFDISICINVIHHIHITDFEKALKELSRISDKYLILEIRNKKNIFNFWYKYFALPVLYKNLPVYSCSITEVNNVLKNQKFNLEMAKGIYSRKWLCRRLLLIFRRINVNRY
jgi:ubiquinone/menaquinone biosynthesis C-methylase UbiE